LKSRGEGKIDCKSRRKRNKEILILLKQALVVGVRRRRNSE